MFEMAYFYTAFKTSQNPIPTDFDLVLAYSEDTSMEPARALAIAKHKLLYVSQAPWNQTPSRTLSPLKENRS